MEGYSGYSGVLRYLERLRAHTRNVIQLGWAGDTCVIVKRNSI